MVLVVPGGILCEVAGVVVKGVVEIVVQAAEHAPQLNLHNWADGSNWVHQKLTIIPFVAAMSDVQSL